MQSHVPWVFGLWIEAGAIIFNHKHHFVVASLHPYHNAGGLSVLDRVVQGFLCDAIETFFGLYRKIRLLPKSKLYLQAVAGM
jgi:hypothetical protein